jgi:hypothetical protein
MKYILVVLALTGCGYSSVNNEVIGQVKKVVKNTPLICDDYVDVDLSLGIMRNGVGSMSTQDMWLYVPDAKNVTTLQKAVETGSLVKVTFGQKRWYWCVDEGARVTDVELVP